MGENLHTDHFYISADLGWQQMEHALNLHMPVKKRSVKNRIVSLLPAFILSAGFMFAYLPVHNGLFQQHLFSAASHQVPGGANAKTRKQKTDVVALKYLPAGLHSSFASAKTTAAYPLRSTGKMEVVVTDYPNLSVNTLSKTIDAAEHEAIIPEKNSQSNSQTDTALITSVKHRISHLDLYAGAAINVGYNQQQQRLHPYPVVAIQYHVNSKLFLAAGVSLLSPVAGEVSGVSKKVFINDTASNVQYLQEVTHQTKLQYADIPFTIGYKFSNKWSIESGLQFSLLMHKKVVKTSQYIDYQLNDVSRPYQASLQPSAVIPQETYPVTIRRTDPRLVAGIHYTRNRISFGASWQYALQKPAATASPSAYRNQLVSLHALFRLK